MSEAVIEVRGLEVSYGAIRALRGVDLDVAAGESVAIVGANGAGKSTLMRALAGLVPAAAGRARFGGLDIRRSGAHELARAGLHLVPEGRGTLQAMSVAENLKLAWDVRPATQSYEVSLAQITRRFPRLAERIDQPAGNLSGGEQQMLAIARALINPPRVLLLDEPSMGLSPRFRKEVFQLLAELRATGMTLLIVEQNVRSALSISDRAYVLSQGRFTATGPARELAHDSAVVAAYLGHGKLAPSQSLTPQPPGGDQ